MRVATYLFVLLVSATFAGHANASDALWRTCVDQPNVTNIGVADCLSDKLTAEEATLNALTQEQLANARETDADIRRDEPDAIFAVQEAKLKASHQAFEAYKKADCDRVYDSYTGGSGANTANLICQLKHTHERIRLLKAEIQ